MLYTLILYSDYLKNKVRESEKKEAEYCFVLQIRTRAFYSLPQNYIHNLEEQVLEV